MAALRILLRSPSTLSRTISSASPLSPHLRSFSSTYDRQHDRQQDRQQPILNDALRHLPTVRLISETGENCGTMTGEQAFQRARSVNLDVIQVHTRTSDAPVLRILDYTAAQESKRKKAYEKNKADKQTRKLQKRENKLKEIRLSPATDNNDIEIKVRRAKQFLTDGYRVRVFMIFKRGQGSLHETAKQSLISVAQQLSDFGKIQGIPTHASIPQLFDRKKPSFTASKSERNRTDRTTERDDNSDDNSDDNNGDDDALNATPRKKPLEILLYPLPRKKRESLLEQQES